MLDPGTEQGRVWVPDVLANRVEHVERGKLEARVDLRRQSERSMNVNLRFLMSIRKSGCAAAAPESPVLVRFLQESSSASQRQQCTAKSEQSQREMSNKQRWQRVIASGQQVSTSSHESVSRTKKPSQKGRRLDEARGSGLFLRSTASEACRV